MAITPFVFAPFGTPGRDASGERTSAELSFTRNFDITKPAVMVFFAHGHHTKLERDVVGKMNVLAQLEKAGLNAVLIAPQLAYNDKDSGPGRFAERGFANRFFDEAALKLAQMHDQQRLHQTRPSPQTIDTFRSMPIIMVSYSGGYGATNAIISNAMNEVPRMNMDARGQITEQAPLGQRIKGAVLLDTLYGGADIYQRFAGQSHRPFVISNYIATDGKDLTRITNQSMERHFAAKGQLSDGAVTPQRNVRIMQEYGDHFTLVQDRLASSLNHVSGYRVAGPAPATTAPQHHRGQPERIPMRIFSINDTPSSRG